MILASSGIIASSISGVDADWLAYYNRVIAAGGSLTTTEQNATKQLVADLKANSLWTPMKAIYPMVGASAAACAQNLKSSSFTGTFTSGWTFASSGVTGTNAFMNTGLKASDLGQNSSHLSIYSRTNSTANMIDMGVYTNANSTYIAIKYSGAIYPTIQGIEASGGATPYSNTTGLIIGNRNNSTQTKFYQNSSLLGTYTMISTTPNNTYSIYLGCYNDQGTPSLYSNKQFSLASLGDGLTDTEASNFYTAVQAFQTTLSRNV